MLQEDNFTNQPSLTVVKEDDLGKEKVLGCTEMTELGIKLFCKTERKISNIQSEMFP